MCLYMCTYMYALYQGEYISVLSVKSAYLRYKEILEDCNKIKLPCTYVPNVKYPEYPFA